MLVISRTLNESFTIGDNIKVTVVGIRGGTIRIGIEAPREIAVVREDANVKVPQKS